MARGIVKGGLNSGKNASNGITLTNIDHPFKDCLGGTNIGSYYYRGTWKFSTPSLVYPLILSFCDGESSNGTPDFGFSMTNGSVTSTVRRNTNDSYDGYIMATPMSANNELKPVYTMTFTAAQATVKTCMYKSMTNLTPVINYGWTLNSFTSTGNPETDYQALTTKDVSITTSVPIAYVQYGDNYLNSMIKLTGITTPNNEDYIRILDETKGYKVSTNESYLASATVYVWNFTTETYVVMTNPVKLSDRDNQNDYIANATDLPIKDYVKNGTMYIRKAVIATIWSSSSSYRLNVSNSVYKYIIGFGKGNFDKNLL